jgi:hypothetical protein
MKGELHDTDEDDERVAVDPSAGTLYRDHEYWRRETSLSDVKDWSAAELRPWIEGRIRWADPPPKIEVQSLVQRVLRLMEEEDIGGELLLAGGKSYLIEKTSLVGMSKADRMRLPHVAGLIFSAAREAEELHGTTSYWNRLAKSSAMGQALCEEYEKTGSIGTLLRLAMEPHPLDVIHFSSICHLEAANDVVEADEYVCKSVGSAASPCLFKVVSVAPREDPSIVWSNLIYARSDLDHPAQGNGDDSAINSKTSEETSPTSRRQRRKDRHGRRQPPHWELLASVDFAQHGSALPGHWHLNTTSCGDVLPHLQISEEEGGGRETWHGVEDSCPLWWHFIPSGMSHKNTPHRLKTLFEEFTGPEEDQRAKRH